MHFFSSVYPTFSPSRRVLASIEEQNRDGENWKKAHKRLGEILCNNTEPTEWKDLNIKTDISLWRNLSFKTGFFYK